jgi:nucleoid DNA-binding protein
MAIKIDDLCNLIANEVKGTSTPNSVRRVLDATYRVILKQLELNEEICFYNFGKFEIYDRPSGDKLMGDLFNGGTKINYVKPKKNIKFSPFKALDESINLNNFKLEKKRKRKKTRKQVVETYRIKNLKPKPTMEEIFTASLNESMGRISNVEKE